MPDLKISQLNNGDPAQTADQIPINRAGVNFSVTAGSIASLATTNSANTQILFNDNGTVDGDPNLTFNKTGGIFSLIGQLNVDNIRIDGNVISSTNANGDITVTPNGTGRLIANAFSSSNAIITGGSVNGTPIGATSASTGSFTNVTANGTINFTGASISNLGSFTSAILASAVSDETGSGSLVFGTNPTISGATISGGSINNTPIGGTTPNTGTFTTVTADNVIAPNVATIGQFSWDNSSVTTPVAKPQVTPSASLLASIQGRMRGCLLLDNGQVNYYLNPSDWTQKEDGSASVLTGADGMVMVEIPKFYVKNESGGTLWKPVISATPLSGYSVHPAFIRNGVEVPYRYYSAYDCCVFDGTNFIVTDNGDNQSARVNTATDKLVSVSGQYPMAGLTRGEFRLLAANRGPGWSIGDYALWSAIGLLLAVEYQTLQSQSAVGLGNTRNTTWPAGGTFATDNRTCQSGFGNALGNGSGGSATGTINTSNNGDYVKYRGIENFWGNVWNWTDGIVLYSQGNTAGNKVFGYWSNTVTQFADVANASAATAIPTGYGFLGEFANTLNNNRYATTFLQTNTWAMVVTNFSSTSTQGTNDFYRTNSGWRVLLVGGGALDGANAGAFAFSGGNDSALRNRQIGARLAF